MAFIFYIFTLFLSYNSIQSYEINFSYETNLWQQIIPLIKKTEANKTPNMQEILKDCIAQAILLDGNSPKPLDRETLQTLQSLHVFSNILPKIAKNNLHWGYFELAKNICQITDDLEILKKRNIFTLHLQNDPRLLEKLNKSLESLRKAESDFLLLFYFKFLKKEQQTPSGPIEEGLFYLEEVEKKILSNRYTGGIWKLGKQFKSLLGVWAALGTLYYFSDFHQYNISEFKQPLIPLIGSDNANKIASSWPVSIPYTTLNTIGTILGILMSTKSLKADFDQASCKQKSLMLFKDVLITSQNIVKIVQENPILEDFLPEYTTIKKFAEWKKHPECMSQKMYELLNLLDYYPFNQEPSAYPVWQGKIYETFILYEELKYEIVPLWQALGDLDAHIATQTILANHPNLFCIPQWSLQDTPMIDIQDYWHPMISPQKVVRNDISLGTNTIARNSIITGANAGGKTTAMTAIMLCAIFAQSLGIVPAQFYNATPFTHMHTYLDITTNLAENESLFVAQANRAKDLYESIQNCKLGAKTLTILDEIFTGTRADFAEQASFEFAQKLGNMSHSISIIATHFPKLTELEQSGLFINYQAAPASINFDGTLNYPYLIIPGVSTQNIADIILKRKGILN
jgi:hypothetical protein